MRLQAGAKIRDQELPGAYSNPQRRIKAALTDPRSAKKLPLTPLGLSARIDQRFPRSGWWNCLRSLSQRSHQIRKRCRASKGIQDR